MNKYYTSVDGLQLHYLDNGNSDATKSCLLLHGFTNDAHIFDGLAQQLNDDYRVISVDFRGHGDSAWDPKQNYQHDFLVSDILQLWQELALDGAHIIGHSLGARIAILLLGRHQLNAASLSIIDTGPDVRALAVNKVRKDAETTPKAFASVAAYHDFLAQIYFLAEPEKVRQLAYWGLKTIDGKLCPKTDPAFTQALWKSDSHRGNSQDLSYPLNEELWLQLAKISCPALVLKGQASAILAKITAEKMANEVLAQGELAIVERAGHALMVDNSTGFEAIQTAFIRRHSR